MQGSFYPFQQYIDDLSKTQDGSYKIYPSKYLITPTKPATSADLNSLLETVNSFASETTYKNKRNLAVNELLDNLSETSEFFYGADINFIGTDVYDGKAYFETYLHFPQPSQLVPYSAATEYAAQPSTQIIYSYHQLSGSSYDNYQSDTWNPDHMTYEPTYAYLQLYAYKREIQAGIWQPLEPLNNNIPIWSPYYGGLIESMSVQAFYKSDSGVDPGSADMDLIAPVINTPEFKYDDNWNPNNVSGCSGWTALSADDESYSQFESTPLNPYTDIIYRYKFVFEDGTETPWLMDAQNNRWGIHITSDVVEAVRVSLVFESNDSDGVIARAVQHLDCSQNITWLNMERLAADPWTSKIKLKADGAANHLSTYLQEASPSPIDIDLYKCNRTPDYNIYYEKSLNVVSSNPGDSTQLGGWSTEPLQLLPADINSAKYLYCCIKIGAGYDARDYDSDAPIMLSSLVPVDSIGGNVDATQSLFLGGLESTDDPVSVPVVILFYNIYTAGGTTVCLDMPLGLYIPASVLTIQSNQSWSARIATRFAYSGNISASISTSGNTFNTLQRLLESFGDTISTMNEIAEANRNDINDFKATIDTIKRSGAVNVPYLMGDIWYVNGHPAKNLLSE